MPQLSLPSGATVSEAAQRKLAQAINAQADDSLKEKVLKDWSSNHADQGAMIWHLVDTEQVAGNDPMLWSVLYKYGESLDPKIVAAFFARFPKNFFKEPQLGPRSVKIFYLDLYLDFLLIQAYAIDPKPFELKKAQFSPAVAKQLATVQRRARTIEKRELPSDVVDALAGCAERLTTYAYFWDNAGHFGRPNYESLWELIALFATTEEFGRALLPRLEALSTEHFPLIAPALRLAPANEVAKSAANAFGVDFALLHGLLLERSDSPKQLLMMAQGFAAHTRDERVRPALVDACALVGLQRSKGKETAFDELITLAALEAGLVEVVNGPAYGAAFATLNEGRVGRILERATPLQRVLALHLAPTPARVDALIAEMPTISSDTFDTEFRMWALGFGSLDGSFEPVLAKQYAKHTGAAADLWRAALTLMHTRFPLQPKLLKVVCSLQGFKDEEFFQAVIGFYDRLLRGLSAKTREDLLTQQLAAKDGTFLRGYALLATHPENLEGLMKQAFDAFPARVGDLKGEFFKKYLRTGDTAALLPSDPRFVEVAKPFVHAFVKSPKGAKLFGDFPYDFTSGETRPKAKKLSLDQEKTLAKSLFGLGWGASRAAIEKTFDLQGDTLLNARFDLKAGGQEVENEVRLTFGKDQRLAQVSIFGNPCANDEGEVEDWQKKVAPAIEKLFAKTGFTCPRGKKVLAALGEDELVTFSSASGVTVDVRVYWDEPTFELHFKRPSARS